MVKNTWEESMGVGSGLTLAERLRVVRRFRHRLASESAALVQVLDMPSRLRRPEGRFETLAAEILPLAEACRFLERRAASLLAPQRCPSADRPAWLAGVTVEIHREPVGHVGILAPANYPIFLPGVQLLQAWAAGNRVSLKPGRVGSAAQDLLVRWLREAGAPAAEINLLPATVEAGEQLAAEADLLLLTGAAATGDVVAQRRGARPSVMELSGCDAVFVLPGADLNLAADALTFGLLFNESHTCIAPRRVLAPRPILDQIAARLRTNLERRLQAAASARPPHAETTGVDRDSGDRTCPTGLPLSAEQERLVAEAAAYGATVWRPAPDTARNAGPVLIFDPQRDWPGLMADPFGPLLTLLPVADIADALAVNAACPYALGAAVFGPWSAAQALARQIDAGCVVVNDLIAPTADPRVPFAGRRRSGFGVTRGGDGLLQLTVPKAIITRTGGWSLGGPPARAAYRHFDRPHPGDADLLAAYLAATHSATLLARLHAWGRLLALGIRRTLESS